jgi:cell division protein FtsQ
MGMRGERGWRLVRAAPASIPASVRRFHARARARRLRSARPWFIAAAVVALFGVLSWVALDTPALGVSRVRVTGGGFVTATDVRTAAGVVPGTPLASVNTGVVERRVERLTGVARAAVSRNWPHTLVIAVTLRTPVAAIPQPGGGYLLVDAAGVPYRTVAALPEAALLVDLATPGPADPSTRAALAVMTALPHDLRDRVRRVTASTPARVELLLVGGRTVIWGDSTDNATKARVALTLLDQPGSVIDVSAPTVMTVN